MEWVRDYPDRWPEVMRRCEGCAGLLGYFVHGWGQPSDGWLDRLIAKGRRRRYLHNRRRAGRVPTVETEGGERPLRLDDDRETWARAERHDGEPVEVEGKFAPEDDEDRPRRGGRPPKRAWFGPHIVDDVVGDLERFLAHLETVPTSKLADHFNESYGEAWPPHLEDVHRLLLDRWRRGGNDLSAGRREYERRGVARRVARVLPVEMDVKLDPEGEGRWRERIAEVTYEPCPFEYEHIRKYDPNEGPARTLR